MTTSTEKSAFWQGFRDGLPFVLVVGPFGLLFGVVATEAGLPLIQAFSMTLLVIAGASQLTALQLILDGAGVWMALAGALAVNLRMAMYSASLVPWLGSAPLWQRALVSYLNFDQTFALSVARYEAEPQMTVGERVAFFLGVAIPIAPLWASMTIVGALVGSAIPDEANIDFALPITFLAVVAPMLKTLAHVAAAVTSVIVALLLAGLPAGTGLLLAAACAMAVGATVEILMGRPAP
ncbi:AzlC family ABC transporter permease [Pelagovum pacificum]|uniref:Branched-chain amino acid ABC transporter permease n=1 Tax=Pelagovum pacificum TaxID=2588711 RepID=A0A5C5GJL8_9RHOB|nr:AzlC family ABC transporter permease [Pelagovum pacificum]QQA43214.1 AzlC family ABC transporter permease [Pelagovum pacificum]TNY33646.1 branched-chain amino acid ABC transporter permease [Pelagovum pacificum]